MHDYVENLESWNSAKEILTKLSQELERSMGNSILKICNYNVSDAVQLFAGILSSRLIGTISVRRTWAELFDIL